MQLLEVLSSDVLWARCSSTSGLACLFFTAATSDSNMYFRLSPFGRIVDVELGSRCMDFVREEMIVENSKFCRAIEVELLAIEPSSLVKNPGKVAFMRMLI